MKLRFEELENLLKHIDQITADNHRVLGQWTAAQNFYHLAAAFDGSINGLPSGYSFPARFIARQFRWFFTRYRFLPGIPIPSSIKGSLGPPESVDFDSQKQRLILAIKTFQQHNETHPPHPVFGKFTRAEWIGFHLRHCERHLSFISINSATS